MRLGRRLPDVGREGKSLSVWRDLQMRATGNSRPPPGSFLRTPTLLT